MDRRMTMVALVALRSSRRRRRGGLLAYGVHFPDLWGRAPSFVDRILKGASPSRIPVERASRFALTVNLRTAGTLGVTVPQSLVLRADDVIR